ncbi:hypothetical protein BALOs_1133 [Halobacteriovorax sp. BALOs_7]|uniref:30S ribosomal protein S20 n=1 Tax=unclassified Halobacteriovorax TaxID=2639665 RepID=UPI000EA28336|nr:30S ribosomal protein S20 [Halobacteriovorax sp. BALOs_7]AYF44140.1 hypothetical protein BALOs_1133 [Halobacteriovorax sp. BALOs_7]
MKYLGLVVFGLLFNFSLQASGVDRNMTASMIDKMVAKGIIGPEEANNAKSKLAAMPDQEWNQLSDLGRKLASKQMNNKNVDFDVESAAKNIDFDSKQFKDIQSQVKSIMNSN